MKKTIIILLILSICVALFACNRTENDESSDKPKEESSAFVDDGSTAIIALLSPQHQRYVLHILWLYQTHHSTRDSK